MEFWPNSTVTLKSGVSEDVADNDCDEGGLMTVPELTAVRTCVEIKNMNRLVRTPVRPIRDARGG